MSIPSPYNVVFPEYFSRDACLLDHDQARCCIRLLKELQEIQQMPDGEEKSALLDAFHEDFAEIAHDPERTKAWMKVMEARMVKVDCRLKLQDALEAYKVASDACQAAKDAVE